MLEDTEYPTEQILEGIDITSRDIFMRVAFLASKEVNFLPPTLVYSMYCVAVSYSIQRSIFPASVGSPGL